MLKTLKWVYELGYKHAETRYYHELNRVVSDTRPTELEIHEIVRDESKVGDFRRQKLASQEELHHNLTNIIERVFHPIEYLSQDDLIKRNRFEP